MRTIITGLPYFSKYIQEKLKDSFIHDKFVRLNTYYSFWDKIRYLVLLPFCDVIYSINGATHGSKVINLAIRFRKRIIFHWVGSDVMLAVKTFEKEAIVADYIDKVIHIADAPWLSEELAGIGIDAQFIPLNACAVDMDCDLSMPETFSILTYIPQNKEKFYGISFIVNLARKFPDIEIRIAGMSSCSVALPENIRLLGWVEDMTGEIRKNTVCIRMPEHDGLSFFVLESLANQRYVIYNQKFDPCLYATDDRTLQLLVSGLKEKSERQELSLNMRGKEYVLKNFNEPEILRKIYEILKGEVRQKNDNS